MKEEIKITTQQELKSIFETYYTPLVSFANNYILQLGACEDLVQDVFITLWNTKPSFKNDTAFRSYVYKTVKNKCLNILKHEIVKEKYAQSNSKQLQNETFTEIKIIQEEITRTLHKAITTLPERRQEVIKLTLQGLKNNEIAERLSIQLQTVKTLKSQAYKTLREYFKATKL